MSLTELSRPPSSAVAEGDAFLRLASCPRCQSRRRALAEVRGRLLGRCLACGEELTVPLAVETQPRLELVGRRTTPRPGHRLYDTGD
jgi:hypothetical protein